MNTENWDDDFVFNPTSNNNNNPQVTSQQSDLPRVSASSSTSDWDADPLQPPAPRLHQWAEKTPTKTRSSHGAGEEEEKENWDDDFEDGDDASPQSRHPHGHTHHPPHTTTYIGSSSSDDDDFEFGAGARDDAEDRTVTARSRRRPSPARPRAHSHSHKSSPPPPVPALPPALAARSLAAAHGTTIEPLPRSPTASVFSVPASSTAPSTLTHAPHHMSASHIPLRGGGAGFSALPPSPPLHRERRRLRKKSRAPPGAYEGVFELAERARSPSPAPAPRRTSFAEAAPPQSQAPPAQPQSPTLLARIGSVKKWGVRRKRGSTGAEHPAGARPASAASDLSHVSGQGSSVGHGNGNGGGSNWFFRSGGAGSGGAGDSDPPAPGPGSPARVRRERSFDADGTPTKAGAGMGMGKRRPSKLFAQLALGNGSAPAAPSHGPADGFNSNPNSNANSNANSNFTSNFASAGGKRHVSDGSGLSSVGRAASTTLVNPSTDSLLLAKDGGSGGKRWARRLSLVGVGARVGHRRGVSGPQGIGIGAGAGMGGVFGAADDVEVREATEIRVASDSTSTSREGGDEAEADEVGVRAGGGVGRGGWRAGEGDGGGGGGLLPPIELHPPSPPATVSPAGPAPPGVPPDSHPPRPNPSPNTNTNPNPNPTSPTTPNTSPPATSPTTTTTPKSTLHPRPPRSPGSPQQSASLGRAAGPSVSPRLRDLQARADATHAGAGAVPRRNSLGDLKIPTRISQAQVSLRRDLGLVREFAGSVEQLKSLQATYRALLSSVQCVLDALPPAPPALPQQQQHQPSSGFFHLPRSSSARPKPKSAPFARARSNTNPLREKTPAQIAASLVALDAKYRVSWECAELLIELGGGTPAGSAAPPSPSPLSNSSTAPTPTNTITSNPLASSASDPAALHPHALVRARSTRRSRERAITLSGDEAKPPPASWGAAAGRRNDLSERQLVILREMLHTSRPASQAGPRIPEEGAAVVVDANRAWRWGDAMGSTVTLPPSEDSAGPGWSGSEAGKKRRRMGMSGFREMLRAMKRGQPAQPLPPLPAPPAHAHGHVISSASESSIGDAESDHSYAHGQIGGPQKRRAKTSTGPESIRSTHPAAAPPLATSPYGPSSVPHRASPRRPSLASIFRLGQKSKTASSMSNSSSVDSVSIDHAPTASDPHSTPEEEDWDRMDSASDLEHAARALGSSDGLSTVRGKKGRSPYLQQDQPQQQPHQSSSSLRPVTPKTGASASRSSLFGGAGEASPTQQLRTTRLSNVEESAGDHRGSKALRKGKHRSSLPVPNLPRSRSRMALQTDSVRSAPPQAAGGEFSEFKLAMTPENIKPLLENAREVQVRLEECVAELKVLLATASA